MPFKLLNDELVKANLSISSLIVTSYELLQSIVTNKIKYFLCVEYELIDGEMKLKESDDYLRIKNQKHPELNGSKNLYVSSCKWLLSEDCITEEDYHVLQEIRLYRNKLVHQLPNFIIDDNISIDILIFDKIKASIEKIEKWWILFFEIPVNPDFDNQEISEEDISSGIIILINYLSSMLDAEIARLRELGG